MRLRSTLLAAVVGAAAILAPVVVAPTASAHGWVTNPPSRQDHCANDTAGFDCGAIKYEPQSVEAPQGSLECSGGSGFSILADESKPWPRTTIGSSVDMKWQITARHSTATWEYFVDGVLHRTFNDNGAKPEAVVTHRLENLPAGDHTILARWNVADTINAFYACVDVTVDGDGTVEPPTDPTDPPTEPTDPPVEPGECEDAAWNPSSVYLGGTKVSYEGHTFQAKWWTQGDTPSTTADQWAVWTDLGAC